MSTQKFDELVNEKGLTRTEWNVKTSKIERDKIIGAILTGFLGLGNALYQGGQVLFGRPEQPEGYQTYVDAQTTLSNLVSHRLEVKNEDRPYKTPELERLFEDVFGVPHGKKKSLETAISAVKEDIVKMERDNQEYASYPNMLSSYQDKHLSYELFGTAGIIGLGLFTNGLVGSHRKRKIGSDKFKVGETSQ